MINPFNPFIKKTSYSPISEAYSWLENTIMPKDLELMNLSQAAPNDPPPLDIRQAIADAALNEPNVHLYGPVLGNDNLRFELGGKWTELYSGKVDSANIGITSGCNQAFCSVIATIAKPGDNIIVPSPWYFNHKMWLDMAAINTLPLPLDKTMLPIIDRVEDLVDKKTKAIVLVTPNNPTGLEYPDKLLLDFYKIAQKNNLLLIVDETYRDFHSRNNPIHNLFKESDWKDTLVSLYSFSKAYRLTGHRVGAIITNEKRLQQIEKFLDSVTICPNQLGQVAALYGLKNSSSWLEQERIEILNRQNKIKEGFKILSNWKLKGCGAYFAYVENPFNISSDIICQKLLANQGILSLPERMFTPKYNNIQKKHIRFAFANINCSKIDELFERLKNFSLN
ncbi:MAG: aminotransferase [Paracoccaceae bacterium]